MAVSLALLVGRTAAAQEDEPVDAIDPADPVEPVDPVDPVEPVEPLAPEPPPEPATPDPAPPKEELAVAKAIDADKTEQVDELPEEGDHEGGFAFGSYGRVIAATDAKGRPGRDADLVAHGSRLDHENYVELELRRDDHWLAVDAYTRFVGTLALGHPIFHYDGEFDAAIAVRNLYLEERGLGLGGLSIWAGSRMLRGDDIYLLDFWPLDNLNTLGGGARYEAETLTTVEAHFGVAQPQNPFYRQQAERPRPLNQFGTATVDLLDRVRLSGSLKAEQQFRFGDDGAGMKVALYGEVHQVPSGQRETESDGIFEDVPRDDGYVIGGQVGGFTGERNTHMNLFVRYATGVAAYGEFAHPTGLSPEEKASGAHELLFAAGGNAEFGPVTVMLGGYFRSFRNASGALDFEDVDEGIVIVRPHVFFVDWAGVAVEGSYQAQQRGVLADIGEEQESSVGSTNPQAVVGRVGRIGVVPFITPAGRGSYSRPMIWFIYSAAFRDDGARALYPPDDVYSIRDIEHFLGIGAEWWFGSTSYGDAP